MQPYALTLYVRFRRGATVAELAAQTGIPPDRIVKRLQAAARFLKRQGVAHAGRFPPRIAIRQR